MNIQLKDVDNVVFNGIDVNAVKFNDVLVWRKWETLEYTGAVPVTIYAAGEPLIDLLISGNMQQTGTPTPTTPIQPQECGERTAQLFDRDNTTVYNAYIGNDSKWLIAADISKSIKIPVRSNTQYTLSISEPNAVFRIYETNNINPEPSASGLLLSEIVRGTNIKQYTFTTASDTKFIVFQGGGSTVDDWFNTLMLNTGSTALPYSPYGYKLDISSGGENLCSLYKTGYTITQEGNEVQNSEFDIYSVKASSNTQYTLSFTYPESATYRMVRVHGYKNGVWHSQILALQCYLFPFSFTIPDGIDEVRFHIVNTTSNIMLNLGSTALPYEPYNRTTTPIYLGEVLTTRQVKKLVLTGDEGWTKISDQGTNARFQISPALPNSSYNISQNDLYMTHYSNSGTGAYTCYMYATQGVHGAMPVVRVPIGEFETAADFTAYLAQQYANGTPVCVWYVLATPTTAVVNEPLRKIGTYADTLSVPQSIPTVEGENVIDVETTLKPSSIYLKYKGKST